MAISSSVNQEQQLSVYNLVTESLLMLKFLVIASALFARLVDSLRR